MNKIAEETTKVSKTSSKVIKEADTEEANALRLLDILKVDRKKKKAEPALAKEKEVDGDMIKEWKANIHTPKNIDVKLKLVRTLKDGGTNPTQKLYVIVNESEIEFKGFVARHAYSIFTKDYSTSTGKRKAEYDPSVKETLKSLF